MKRIAILASGSGTNAENIARTFNGGSRVRVTLVLTNRRTAGVAERMERLGVPVEYIPNSVWDNEPERVADLLRSHGIDLVVLAGFMHYISPAILAAFPGRVINIHPALLPAHGGKGMWGDHVHRAVLEAGDTVSGPTVHYVDPEYDHGEVIMRQEVPVMPGDTVESLAARVHEAEYTLYPRAIIEVTERLEKDDEKDDEKNDGAAHGGTRPADEEWADVLGVRYDPSKTTPPAMPASAPPAVPPAAPGEAPHAAAAAGTVKTDGRDGSLPPMPPAYLLWAVLSAICCCFVPGIAAIIFSSQVSTRYHAGDYEGARRASRRAQIWIIASFALGVISASVYLPLSMAGVL